MQKLVRLPVLISCLLAATMLSVVISPIMTQNSILEESGDDRQYSSPIQATISPSSGWTSGGEEITITGSGFSDLAFSNSTDDGINHQWVETTMDYTDEAGRYNAIVMDSSGHIHVVHINGGNYQIRHSIYDGSSWNSVTINNCESSYCWDVHMAIDDNDELHVAYTASSGSGKVIYMHYDGTSWTDTLVSSNARFGAVGIAVDSNNYPHISYAVDGEYCGDGLRLASYDGSSWVYEGVDIGSNRGCESAILIDNNDHIYIAYQNRDESKLKIATDKSGSWDSYTVDTGTTQSNLYPGYMTSMAMDVQGQFHIAHFDEKDDDLRYSTGAPNSQWTTTIVESSGHTGRNPSIALDFSGNPHIAYNSWSGWDLKYAVYNSVTSSWDKSSISTTGDVGKGNSLIIDPNGVMHVAFSDEDDDVLKYATKSTGLIPTREIRVQFGQYGNVTGTVVDDSTIIVMTPSSGLIPDTIDITLWDKYDNSHTLSSTFQFIDQNDLDSDGVPNINDDCPEAIGNSTQDVNGCPDDDGDGYSNSGDAFPGDVSEWMDSDGDGVGDNSDAFPTDPYETLDSDADGVGDNADAFPDDANESVDSDGDGVGNNSDAFPDDANESVDSDGDGIGDNSDEYPFIDNYVDADSDGYPDLNDSFPNDATQWMDLDGDRYGDNQSGNNPDLFTNLSTQWADTDGDGYGDNWGNSSWNSTRVIDFPGEFVEGAELADHCPTVSGNSTADGIFGCPDGDGDGIADQYDEVNGSAVIEEEETESESESESEDETFLDSLFSGDSETVTQTVGFGAIILALLTLLQTNLVAGLLPDAFRWVQVLRRSNKLSKEEIKELTYLQSLVQAYYYDTSILAEEFEKLRADLTGRYMNNEIKKNTREKILTLLDDIQYMNPEQIASIANSEAYFGLVETTDVEERTELLEQELAMSADVFESKPTQAPLPSIPDRNITGRISSDDGHEYLEHPTGSGVWFYRNQTTNEWDKWE